MNANIEDVYKTVETIKRMNTISQEVENSQMLYGQYKKMFEEYSKKIDDEIAHLKKSEHINDNEMDNFVYDLELEKIYIKSFCLWLQEHATYNIIE